MEVNNQLHAPAHFTPAETAAGTCWIRGWVGLRARLNALEKRKISTAAGNQTPVLRSSGPQFHHYNDAATPAKHSSLRNMK